MGLGGIEHLEFERIGILEIKKEIILLSGTRILVKLPDEVVILGIALHDPGQ